MTTWTRFRVNSDGSEIICAVVGGRKHADGMLFVWDSEKEDCNSWQVRADDADRVWAELCARCKPERTGPDVGRVESDFGTPFYLDDKGGDDWVVKCDTDCGFPADKLDALGQFIADCVNGVYVGKKA